MAVYFLNLKNFSRASGSSAVGAAAYRSGERLRDELTGKIHDHSERRDVLYKEIILPAQAEHLAPAWARERTELWNAAERAENRQNARVAREYLVLLPHELAAEARIALARRFAGELSDRYGFGVDLAVHAPRQFSGSDPRNFHAHLLATTRYITADGLGAKTEIEWHDVRRIESGLVPSAKELLHVRRRWAEHANEALASAGLDVRIDHRPLSLAGESNGASRPGNAPTFDSAEKWNVGTLEDVRRRAREAWRELRLKGEPTREETRERGGEEDLVR